MIRVEDLMIGDWVLLYDKPRKVEIIYDYGRVQVGCIEEDCTVLSSIPLTPEILEKNGFEKLGYEGWEFDSEEETRRDCPNYQIIWRRDYPRPHNTNLKITSFIAGIGNFRSFDIMFVHELQHAFKLCGIDKEIVI